MVAARGERDDAVCESRDSAASYNFRCRESRSPTLFGERGLTPIVNSRGFPLIAHRGARECRAGPLSDFGNCRSVSSERGVPIFTFPQEMSPAEEARSEHRWDAA